MNKITKKNITSNKDYAIQVKNYTKKFNKFVAVSDVSFAVKHGKIHGFIGPNGAGKTTTIKAMIGAYYKNQGEIYIEGFDAGTVKAKRKIGYIPERASFPKQLNSLEYLINMGELSGFSPKQSRQKAIKILKDLDLFKHRFRKPSFFSSGMKKKILVAQAMMLDPTVLILDEPAANLDPTARNEMFETFRKLSDKGCTIFISSHILTELQSLINEVTFISQGKIRYSGSIDDLASENGYLVNFINSKSPKARSVIKKFNLTKTTSGWKTVTKTEKETIKQTKAIIEGGVKINTISFLKSNLASAYDRLVINHGRESGVEKTKNNLFSKVFSSKKLQKKVVKNKVKNVSQKTKTTKEKGK